MADNRIRAVARPETLSEDTEWRCAVCDDERDYYVDQITTTPILIDGHRYCVDQPQVAFQIALESEESWPPTVQNNTLDIENFVNFFPDDFVAQYRAREAMYNVAPSWRIFCP